VRFLYLILISQEKFVVLPMIRQPGSSHPITALSLLKMILHCIQRLNILASLLVMTGKKLESDGKKQKQIMQAVIIFRSIILNINFLTVYGQNWVRIYP
jgi:hypothetical protein